MNVMRKAFDARARRAAYRIVQADLRARGIVALELCDAHGRRRRVDITTAAPEQLCEEVDRRSWEPPPGS